MRTSRYKYIRDDEPRGMDEVYDIVKDPHELDNLYPNRVPPAVMANLTARLAKLLSAR